MTMRQSMALPLAALMTFALFWGMQQLIKVDEEYRPVPVVDGKIVWDRVLKDTDVTEETPKPRRPDLTNEMPPPPAPVLNNYSPTDSGFETVSPTFDETVDLGPQGGIGQTDVDTVPLVRVAPQYPRGALARGIEGWVEVEFTISKFGTVVDPRVADADPTGIFDRAALKAVRGWKYKPQIVGGEAVERHGVRVVITFELDK